MTPKRDWFLVVWLGLVTALSVWVAASLWASFTNEHTSFYLIAALVVSLLVFAYGGAAIVTAIVPRRLR
jgi:hypothetical protein